MAPDPAVDAVPQAVPWGRVRGPRRIADRAMKVLCVLFIALGVFVLGWILAMLAWEGLRALGPRIFT